MSTEIRPANCAICGKQMFYSDDPRHEPEVQLTVELPKWQEEVSINNFFSKFGVDKHYIHLSCWNQLPITLKAPIWSKRREVQNSNEEKADV